MAARNVSELRMKQIVVGEWSSPTGASYSVVGLTGDGRVFKYEVNRGGWVPLEMKEVEPRKRDK